MGNLKQFDHLNPIAQVIRALVADHPFARKRSRHGQFDHLVSVARPKTRSKGFRTGVSLHSHTNQSQETLDFLANFGNQYPVMRPLLSRLERRSEAKSTECG
jgi:hypothetical protein